jgi:hypothetical protein
VAVPVVPLQRERRAQQDGGQAAERASEDAVRPLGAMARAQSLGGGRQALEEVDELAFGRQG